VGIYFTHIATTISYPSLVVFTRKTVSQTGKFNVFSSALIPGKKKVAAPNKKSFRIGAATAARDLSVRIPVGRTFRPVKTGYREQTNT
jgi:hypothetical protein